MKNNRKNGRRTRASWMPLHRSADGVWRRCVAQNTCGTGPDDEHRTLTEVAVGGGGIYSDAKTKRVVSPVEDGYFKTYPRQGEEGRVSYYDAETSERITYNDLRRLKRKIALKKEEESEER